MFKAFHGRFPDIGVTETRTVIEFAEGRRGDTFFFLELYCDEVGCDCRRVIVQVHSERERGAGRNGLVASLSYGWEDEQFYRNWASYPLEADDLEELKGPGLQRLAPQTARADEMLAHFRTLLEDATYVQRIKRHYAMFRGLITADADDASTPPLNRQQRRAAGRRRSAPAPLYR